MENKEKVQAWAWTLSPKNGVKINPERLEVYDAYGNFLTYLPPEPVADFDKWLNNIMCSASDMGDW